LGRCRNRYFLEQSNAGAIEGIKDYKYTYTISSYWAGMGMSLTNFNDELAKDFSIYDSIQIFHIKVHYYLEQVLI
jgi:hypothetical protein